MHSLRRLSETELADQLTASLAGLADSKEKSELQQLTHDLQTHQIELEMQNRELHEAQQQLEEARDRYADLYDFAPVSYITFGEKGIIKDINLSGAAMLGRVKGGVINQPFARWIANGDVSIFFNHLRTALQSDIKVTDEIKIRVADEQLLDVRIESVRSRDLISNTFVCRSIILDITENNRIKNEILLQARQLRLITDALPVLIGYIDKNEQHLFANRAYTDWFGVLPEEILGKRINEVWGEENYRSVNEYIKSSLSGKQVIFDMELPLDDNEKKYVNTTLIPDCDSNNQVHGVIAVVGDITDRLAVEVIDRKHLLEAAHFSRLGTMGEMVSEIAHELNQPLAAISIYSDACRRMILSGKGGQDKITESLTIIGKQAVRAGTVIRSIREFVGKKGIKLISISINELVEEALKLLAVEIRSHRVKLDLDLADGLPLALADKILIEQVVLNLSRNALEAMEDIHGSQRLLKIQTSAKTLNEVEVSIEDSGPGLSEEQINKIFEAFHTTKAVGMGMGLTISQSIIDAHNGRLWAGANDLGGTTFSFTLPLATKENDYE